MPSARNLKHEIEAVLESWRLVNDGVGQGSMRVHAFT